MNPFCTALVLSLALCPLACGGAAASASAAPATTAAVATGGGCPLGIEGADVTASDTPDGVALVFTTSTRIDELRTRARTAAELHGPGQHQGTGHDGAHGQGGHHGLHAMHLPPGRATVEDVPNGARLVVVPADAADLSRLRESARTGAQHVRTVCD